MSECEGCRRNCSVCGRYGCEGRICGVGISVERRNHRIAQAWLKLYTSGANNAEGEARSANPSEAA